MCLMIVVSNTWGRTTYYQDTRADDTADSAGSGAIDDEDTPFYNCHCESGLDIRRTECCYELHVSGNMGTQCSYIALPTETYGYVL